MIEIKDLVHVTAIANAGGIQKAAVALGLSQPALTKRLQNIEAKTGLVLFDRQAKGVVLTQAGKLFLEEGEKLLAHSRDFEAKLLSHQKGKGGYISIGIKPGMDDAFFRRSLVEFTKLYPEISVEIQIGATPKLAQRLKTGEIDFALGALGYEDENETDLSQSDELEFEPMFSFPLEIVARKEHPALIEPTNEMALLRYPLIGPTPTMEILKNLKRAHNEAGLSFERAHIRVDDYNFILDLVARTDMWTAIYASHKANLDTNSKFTIVGVTSLMPELKVGLMKRKTWSMTPAATNLVEIIQKHASEWAI